MGVLFRKYHWPNWKTGNLPPWAPVDRSEIYSNMISNFKGFDKVLNL